MSARTKARKRALDILYEAEIRTADPLSVLAEHRDRADPPVPDYAAVLVEGVCTHRAVLDAVVERLARDWALERMPAVDRNLLRLSGYELLYRDEVPGPVAVSEAVGLAGRLSTADSAAFVNGVLGRLLAERDPAAADAPTR